MALAMKADEALDPKDVDALGPKAVVFGTDQGADTVKQLGGLARLCNNLANRHGRVNRHERVTVEPVATG
jgi:hypothetical protein